jgi:hypothetical protein
VKANDTRMNFLNINEETMLNLDLKNTGLQDQKGVYKMNCFRNGFDSLPKWLFLV